jgi:uncharacterized membrane protein HdeD (DUF308 family)
MLLILLSIIDLIAGGLLAFCEVFPYAGSAFVGTLGAFMLAKGAWSVLTAAAANFYMDFIGALDIVCGILLVVTTFGFSMHFFVYFAVALILKGIYSFIIGLGSR